MICNLRTSSKTLGLLTIVDAVCWAAEMAPSL